MQHVIYDENGNMVQPVFQVGFRTDDHLVALIRSDIDVTFNKHEDTIQIIYGTDNNIENLQEIACNFGLISNTTEVTKKRDVYNNMTVRAIGSSHESITIGNVTLFSPSSGFRKPVPISNIENAGWTVSEWPVETGYQTTFYQIINNGSNYIIATPIKADGTIVTQSDFNSYISECCEESEPMEYDKNHDKLILGITENEDEATVLISLLTEWEDYLHSKSVGTTETGRNLYDIIIEEAMKDQDKDVETICSSIGIDNVNVINIVNQIYPVFNCDTTEAAWGRIIKMLYDELWTIFPRRE